MLDNWEGGWGSGSSCWTLGRGTGIVEIYCTLGSWDSGSSCWTLGGRLR